jgi:inner membrane protein YidH
MSTNEEPSQRFEVRVTSDSHFGWIRTRMALERTLMAWVRTGVAPARRPQAPRHLGLALIGAGVLALVISGWQYRRVVRYLWSPAFRPLAGLEGNTMKAIYTQTPTLGIVAVVILIGIFAFFAVLLRIV